MTLNISAISTAREPRLHPGRGYRSQVRDSRRGRRRHLRHGTHVSPVQGGPSTELYQTRPGLCLVRWS